VVEIVHESRIAELGHYINKSVKLQLQYSGIFKAYQVLSITSTVLYQPGEWLSPKIVDECCTQKGWDVTMIHDDFLKNLLESVISLPKLAIPMVVP
jgi:hypothetical protein